MKRGQVSLFILIGIIVFVLFAIVLYALKPKLSATDFTEPSSTKVFVERCIEDTARYGLFKLGVQGGYIDLPADHATLAHLDIAYAFKNGDTLVSLQEMETQLAAFIDAHLADCVDNGLSAFEERFGKITYALPKTTVRTQAEDIGLHVEFPLTIEGKDGTLRYEDPYEVTIPVRLQKIHDAIAAIVQDYARTKHLLRLECTLDKHFSVKGESFGADNLFVLEDAASILRNSPDRVNEQYRFFFVIKDRN